MFEKFTGHFFLSPPPPSPPVLALSSSRPPTGARGCHTQLGGHDITVPLRHHLRSVAVSICAPVRLLVKKGYRKEQEAKYTIKNYPWAARALHGLATLPLVSEGCPPAINTWIPVAAQLCL